MYYIEDPLDCTLWYSREDIIWGRQGYSAGGEGFFGRAFIIFSKTQTPYRGEINLSHQIHEGDMVLTKFALTHLVQARHRVGRRAKNKIKSRDSTGLAPRKKKYVGTVNSVER